MKIAVSGAAGRMGKRITALGHAHPDIEISGALEGAGNPQIGLDVGAGAGIGEIGVKISDDRDSVIKNCDVLVDFSAPDASVANAEAAVKFGKSIVIGTTGFSDDQRKKLAAAGESIPCLIAPNMSVGVNLLFSIVGQVAKTLGPDYDVEIIEAHHNLKKDAPSGTADKLAHIVADALDRNLEEVGVYGRKGLAPRKQNDIGVMTLRGGDIVGEHTVMFITNGERIELTHRAHSRDALASGGIKAALWLFGREKGMYDMLDVLGLKTK
jgi:4-hydroxy-tetrahydrodipicolinate reductase